jgi:hypothetical protein
MSPKVNPDQSVSWVGIMGIPKWGPPIPQGTFPLSRIPPPKGSASVLTGSPGPAGFPALRSLLEEKVGFITLNMVAIAEVIAEFAGVAGGRGGGGSGLRSIMTWGRITPAS